MPNSLQDACQRVAARIAVLDQSLPDTTPLSRLSSRLGDAAGALERRPPKDYDKVARELHDLVAANAKLTKRQLKDAAWCMWSTTPALAGTTSLAPLLRQIGDADGPRPFRTLASSFMLSFRTDMPGQTETAYKLAALSTRWGKPWSLLQERFQIFDLREGPRGLAAAVIAEDRAAPDILKEAGLNAVSAQSGYAKAVTASLLDMLAQGREPDHLTRLARIKKYALSEAGKPLYQDLVPNLVEALLRPFERKATEKPIRDAFLKIVLGLLGDPRLKPGNWVLVPQALLGIVQRWLTEQSLRQFLDIVDRTADDSMWPYRRAFWEGVYNRGLIDNAWVAFGRDGQQLARRIFGPDARFAALEAEGRQVEAGHAVLLLQIGNGVVADWSHNGKCNIWSDAAQRGAPQLFRPTYGSDQVRIHKGTGNYETDTLLSLMHMSSPTYNWQTKVAERIHQMTGIRVQHSDFRLVK